MSMTTSNFQIPEQLNSWQFLTLQPKTKIPTADMKGWADNRTEKLYKANSLQLAEHYLNGGNIAAVTDFDRFVVACDTVEAEIAVEKRLPRTFTVRSPRHKTKHFYFYGTLTRPIHCKPTAQGDPCIDIKFGNAYVLAPNSQFQNYGFYTVVDDYPIASITEEQLLSAIDEFILPQKTYTGSIKTGATNTELSFAITKLLPGIDCMMKSGYDLSGPHPIHGSTTGSNFHVNTQQNVWYCFRHQSGGGPLELLAVSEGIINCEDAGKGCLRDEKFKLAVKKAQEKGLIPKNLVNFSNHASKSKNEKEEQTAEILTQLQERYIFKTPTDLEDLYYYEDGIYKAAEHKIKSLLENQLGAKATSYFINEIIEHLKRASYTDRSEFNNYTKHNCIPLQNGLFNLSTMQYEPFDPEKIFTYKLNVAYNPAAQCPNWLKFIDQILPREDHPLLQEWLGYCILPAMPKHKIMWFYGTGRNGKGRVIATIEHIIGKSNCSYLELKEFDGEHRFSIAQLYGKLVNVSSEPSTIKDLQTPLLKKITGEDTLDAEVKNKQKRLSFKNVAKPFVLGNVFPKVKDTSVGFWERVKIIRFPYEFTGQNQKDNIENTWLSNPDEVSGIFNWMLTGLNRLLSQGDFTDSKNTKETITEFKRASDTIGAWLDTNCIFDQDKYETNQALYEDYKLYVEDIGMAPETDKRFYQRLRETPRVKPHKKSNSRGFMGIKLKLQQINDNQLSPSEEPKMAHMALMAPFYNFSREQTTTSSSHKKFQTPAICATSAISKTETFGASKICGDCGRFHTEGCYHPALANGGEPSLIKADCSWACECRGFIEKQPELPNYPEEPITT